MLLTYPLQDALVLIEQHKSGFERPGDLEFEDYSQGINRTSSESSLGTPKGPLDLLSKNKSKPFWLFAKKSKVGPNYIILAYFQCCCLYTGMNVG